MVNQAVKVRTAWSLSSKNWGFRSNCPAHRRQSASGFRWFFDEGATNTARFLLTLRKTRRFIAELACFCCFWLAILRALAIIPQHWCLNKSKLTLHPHGIGMKRWIALPLVLRMDFIPRLEYFFQSGHILLFVLEQMLYLFLEHLWFSPYFVWKFSDHLLHTIEYSHFFAFIVLDVVLSCQILQALEG